MLIMISKLKINTINYIVICIEEFAQRLNISRKDAFNFLEKFGGIKFLIDNYEIEHTLSLEDAIDDMITICKNNGGSLT
jgi:hypothetical protein